MEINSSRGGARYYFSDLLLSTNAARMKDTELGKWSQKKIFLLLFGFPVFWAEIEFVTLTKTRLITNHIQFWLFFFFFLLLPREVFMDGKGMR